MRIVYHVLLQFSVNLKKKQFVVNIKVSDMYTLVDS